MSDALPFAIDRLAGAAARAFLAPISQALPTKLSDIFAQKSPYAVASTWFNVGATSGPLQVSRNVTVAGFNIEQSQTPLLEEPTEVVYTVQIPFAELRPQVLQIMHESPSMAAVAASATDGAGVKVPFGSIPGLSHYRVAFVVRRVKSQGVVLESAGGLARGRYLAYVGHDCTLQGENVQTSFGKGQLSSASLTFKLYPDAAVTAEGTEHGFWFDENARTLT